jgi:hypothetical protein
MNTLDVIIEYGLSVRQIPLQVAHMFDFRYHKPGNEVVRHVLKDMTPERFAWFKQQAEKFPSAGCEIDEASQTVTRVYTRYYTTPKHAGWWMCKQTPGTSSVVEWNSANDNLAPTLAESVALFLSKVVNSQKEVQS